MRTLAVIVLGLIGGLVAGVILTEVIVATAVSEPADLADSAPSALLVGVTLPGLAVLGAGAALLVGRRLRHHRSPASAAPRNERSSSRTVAER